MHCNKDYTQKEINELVQLTPDEIMLMKQISFNSTQKKYIVNNLQEGHQINFYNLTYLVNKTDENIQIKNQLEKQEEKRIMENNKLLLECIEYEPELEMGESIPLKKKIKQLL